MLGKIRNVITHPCLITVVFNMSVVIIVMMVFCLLMAKVGE